MSGERLRILVYEGLFRDLAASPSFLDRSALVLLDAASADELVARALAERPHVVVVDEDMPGGGLEALRRLRALPELGCLRCILRTTGGERHGLDGVLSVPRAAGLGALAAALGRLLQVPLRAAARAGALLEASGRAPGGSASLFVGQIVDVSTGGVKLRSSRPLALGERVNLSFALDPDERLVIAAARVVREAPDAPGTSYGLAFTDLTARDREAIARWIARAVEREERRAAAARAADAAPVA